MEQMLQQAASASSASVTPTTSASSTGSGNAGGLAHASTADSPLAGMMSSGDTPAVLPPRRRLVKSAARFELKREGSGGPPGFGGTPLNSPPLTSSGIPVLQGAGISGMVGSPSLPGGFRDRERIPQRSAPKEFAGDQAHGIGGPSKSGRSPHSNAGAMEARHLGRRPEVNMRRHEAGVAQKAAELKRAALLRLQTSNAPGNFKQFDSAHQNYLVPVIPVQFAVKQYIL